MGKVFRTQRYSELPVQELMETAGEHFVPDSNKLIAASDSGHKVEIGDLNGETVVVKPFRGRCRTNKANNEFLVTHNAQMEGIRTIDPVTVIDIPSQKVALFISKYIPGLKSAHTLSFEEDPLTTKGEGVGSAVSDITQALGGLHARKITHGDSQPKNFAFLEEDVFDGRRLHPFIYDFEKAEDHGGLNSRDFVSNAMRDVAWLSYNLGIRQFGGNDDDFAEEALRERAVESYLQAPGARLLGEFITSRLIDRTISCFRKGREGNILTIRSLAA